MRRLNKEKEESLRFEFPNWVSFDKAIFANLSTFRFK